MDTRRRTFLQSGLLALTALLATAFGWLAPRALLAAWPKAAFMANNTADAVKQITGEEGILASREVTIEAPERASDGARVPVTVSTELQDVESIVLLAQNNPYPLIASFQLPQETLPSISTYVNLAQSTFLIAVVKAGGELYSARRWVRVKTGIS